MKKKKIFITGMSGYLGGNLCRQLDKLDWCEKFYGMDVKKPLYKYDKAEFRQMDVNDRGLVEWVAELKPDIMVHLAYILEETHDHDLMHRVNFDGSRNALKAAAAGKVRQVLIASSGTAYGAWPDNPARLKENDPLRANPDFIYATDKVNIEKLAAEFKAAHPETIMSIIRPTVVYGPFVNNYISSLLDHYLIMGLSDFNPPLQFVHEDDVAQAIISILAKEGEGVFNLTPEDTITMLELIGLTQRPSLLFPDWFLTASVNLLWRLRIPLLNFSTAFLDYIRYPWVMDNSRLTEELGFKYRYSTRETAEIMLRAKGWLP
jgi:UDP-glucose 4-epimerase